MANIRARKETGKLFIDFRLNGCRFREQTLLSDNPKNRKQLEAFVQRMEAKILLGEFDYSEFFPGSPNIRKFAANQSSSSILPANGNKKRKSSGAPPTHAMSSPSWKAR